MFIITIIFTLVFPIISKGGEENIDGVTNKVISELRYAKSLAISKNSKVKVKFSSEKPEGYMKMEVCLGDNKQREYILPSKFVLITNNADLRDKNIEFKKDGTLEHRATTLRVRDIVNNDTNNITLTIGFTRIMRVN